jgi:NAD(P)-dependent dehydrogenase (short-subunit alcohol dehydrogenase family)
MLARLISSIEDGRILDMVAGKIIGRAFLTHYDLHRAGKAAAMAGPAARRAEMEIRGSRAVITGGGNGIGRGIALALAEDGARQIVIADINEADGERTAAELRARGVDAVLRKVDVGRREEIEALADFAWDRMGGVDLLFNNAGASRVAAGFDISDQDIAWLIQINIMAVVNGSRIFGRRMLEAGIRGWICNTSSQAGIGSRTPLLATYSGTKHFVVGYTDTLRSDYGDRLGFSVVCPGLVATNMWQVGLTRAPEYGGPLAGDPSARDYMRDNGIPPEQAGRSVVDGVRTEQFFIWTHPSLEICEERFRDQQESSQRQWPGATAARPQPFRPADS